MKHLTTLLILIVLTTTTWSQETWLKVIGGSKDDMGRSIVTTSKNRIVVGGSTTSNDGDFMGMSKGGGEDIFVVGLDGDGTILWKQILGGSGSEICESIHKTSDGGVVLTGYTYSNDVDFKMMNKGSRDIFVIKLDSQGDVVWKYTIGGTGSDWGHSIITTSNDDIVLTGRTNSNDGDFKGMNKGDEDIFVIKLGKDGSVLWKKTFGGYRDEQGNSITNTHDGGFVLTGSTNSLDGDFKDTDIDTSLIDSDIFVIKLDSSGNKVWGYKYGGSRNDVGMSISTLCCGWIGREQSPLILITGYSYSSDGLFINLPSKGQEDIIYVRLQSDGLPHSCVVKYGDIRQDQGLSITTSTTNILSDSTRLINVSGFTDIRGDSSNPDWDIYLSKVDSNGFISRPYGWTHIIGGTGQEWVQSINSDIGTKDGSTVVTGSTNSNDGDFTGMNKGGYDIFIMKLDSDGNYSPPTSINEQTSTSTSLLVTPNPLSTSSTLTYTLDTSSLVRIELMNTLGQVVDVVFDGYRDSGTHGLPLNVSTLTSGMYSVRMTCDKGVYTTQVCVVR